MGSMNFLFRFLKKSKKEKQNSELNRNPGIFPPLKLQVVFINM